MDQYKLLKLEWIGDGTCNPYLNNRKCGYDGGDCCLEIIDATLCHKHSDGCICHERNWFQPTFEDFFNTTCPIWPYLKQVTDSKCHDEFNIKDCNYDGGACCFEEIDDSECFQCICHLDNTRHPSYTEPTKIWPQNSEFKGVPIEYIGICARLIGPENFPYMIQNTECNQEANNRFCNYDNGACCKVDTILSLTLPDCQFDTCSCQFNGYNPLEAFNLLLSQNFTHEPDRQNCRTFTMGNGICDDINNSEECFYDMGDCMVYDDAPKVCNVSNEHIGDGKCDPDANIPACKFDKGDCCIHIIHGPECPEPQYGFASNQSRPCTCNTDGLDHLLASQIADPSCSLDTIGDGNCDDENNKKECFFDWNDCCLEWHIDDSRCTDCICHKYNLKFPNADSTKEERELFKNQTVDIDKLILDYLNPRPFRIDFVENPPYPPGDGICCGFYNIEFFNYDGMDCCMAEISPDSICNDEIGVSHILLKNPWKSLKIFIRIVLVTWMVQYTP